MITRIWTALIWLITWSFSAISGLARTLLGDVSYQAPSWVNTTRDVVAARPWRILFSLVALAGLSYGLQTWINRPAPIIPDLVTVSVDPISLTYYEIEPIRISPITLRFSNSIAAIDALSLPAKGLSIRPEHPGEWRWSDDATLSFTPSADWPIAVPYVILIDPKLAFRAGAVFHDTELEISTPEFSASVQSEFYQDPSDAANKRGIYTLQFSHPVDMSSLAGLLTLKPSLDANGEPIMAAPQFEILPGENSRTVFVKSATLGLPKQGGSLELVLKPGAKSLVLGPNDAANRAANNKAKEGLTSSVSLPSLYSVTVQQSGLAVIDTPDGEAEQILELQFNTEVNDAVLQKALKVVLLPRDAAQSTAAQRKRPHVWSASEVDETALKAGTVVLLSAIPGERANANLHQFKIKVPVGRSVRIAVAANLAAFGGTLMKDAFIDMQQVPENPPLLNFVGEGTLLSLKGERKLSIVHRHVAGMRLRIERVLPDQLHHFVNFQTANQKNPSFYDVQPEVLSERFEFMEALGEAEKSSYSGVDLSNFLSSGKQGVFLVSLFQLSQDDQDSIRKLGPDWQAKYELPGQQRDVRVIVLSDLGVIRKVMLDERQSIFVQSLASGEPVAGAQIDVLAANGSVLLAAPTNAVGRADLASLSGFQREHKPVLIRVQAGGDTSFLSLKTYDREVDFSRFEIDGQSTSLVPSTLSAHVFSDRGLYRPGDTLNLGMIVRGQDWTTALAGVPVTLRMSDPRGDITEQQLSLNSAGFIEASHRFAETAPTGNYYVELLGSPGAAPVLDENGDEIVPDSDVLQTLGSTSVTVQEFLPDQLKVSSEITGTKIGLAWQDVKDLGLLVNVKTLFGTAAQDRRVRTTFTLSPSLPSFAGYADFNFFDPNTPQNQYPDALPELSTNVDGNAQFPLDLSAFAPGVYSLSIYAEAFEAGSGRSVATQAHTIVGQPEMLLGIRSTDPLNYIKKYAARTLDIVALDRSAAPISVAGAVLRQVIVEHSYKSVLTKQGSGVYKYVSTKQSNVVKTEPLNLSAAINPLRLPTDKPGDFTFELHDANAVVLNSVNFSVAGAANLTRSLERNAELRVRLDKASYQPGDWIELNIEAPYIGAGLITIERESVFAHRWFKTGTTSSVQRIQIPEALEAGAYVNVQFLRDPQSSEVFMSPMSVAAMPFKIALDRRTQGLSLSAPKRVKPGEVLTIDVSTDGPAQVVVFAVDEGILQVAGYKLENPLAQFFPKRSLQVQTQQILDMMLPEFSKLLATAAPGGGGDEELGANLNPFKRKRKLPVVYWSGVQSVDGKAQVSYPVPDDFNGSLRLMAVAASATKVGTFTGKTEVRADLVLQPNAPTTLAPGDQTQISVSVTYPKPNAQTDAPAADAAMARVFQVQLSSNAGAQLVEPSTQQISLKPGDEAALMFNVKATDALGAAELNVSAEAPAQGSLKALSASAQISFSVRPAQAYQVSMRAGKLSAPMQQFDGLRQLYPQFAAQQIAASTTPLVLGRALVSYLESFEHACSEQLSSQGMGLLVQASLLDLRSDRPKTAEQLRQIISTLASRQNLQGGYGLWLAAPEADSFVSGYVGLFLAEADARGVAVNPAMFQRTLDYLKTLADSDNSGQLYELRERALAIYVLTKSGAVTTASIAKIEAALAQLGPNVPVDDLTHALLAASYRLLKQDKIADARIAPVIARLADLAAAPNVSDLTRLNDVSLLDSPISSDAFASYLVLKHFPKQRLNEAALERLYRPIELQLNNTLSSAFGLLALEQQGERGKTAELVFTQQTSAIGVSPALFAPLIASKSGAIQSTPFTAGTPALRISQAGYNGPVWYALNESGFDRASATEPVKMGLEVARELRDASGALATSVRLGDSLTSCVSLRALEVDGLRNIAVLDLLPGGFEIVNASNPGTGPGASIYSRNEMALDYADVREDRIVLYASASKSIQRFCYAIKASNTGRYLIPGASAASMYMRKIRAQSGSAGVIEVLGPKLGELK